MRCLPARQGGLEAAAAKGPQKNGRIEAGSPAHNSAELKLFTRYIKYNPRVKAQRAKQLKNFNKYMQRVIDNTETWTGVGEDLTEKI